MTNKEYKMVYDQMEDHISFLKRENKMLKTVNKEMLLYVGNINYYKGRALFLEDKVSDLEKTITIQKHNIEMYQKRINKIIMHDDITIIKNK